MEKFPEALQIAGIGIMTVFLGLSLLTVLLLVLGKACHQDGPRLKSELEQLGGSREAPASPLLENSRFIEEERVEELVAIVAATAVADFLDPISPKPQLNQQPGQGTTWYTQGQMRLMENRTSRQGWRG